MKKISIRKLTLSAMFLALGLILPLFTGQVPYIGKMLLPMHIPVLLCGLICGPICGFIVGFIVPILRSVIFGMPVMFPTAIAMMFELAAYGGIVGLLYDRSKWKCIKSLYLCMLTAMISGRVVWGIVMVILMGMSGNAFTVKTFFAGAFFNAVPGIIVQLTIIPAIMIALNRAKLIPFTNRTVDEDNAYVK